MIRQYVRLSALLAVPLLWEAGRAAPAPADRIVHKVEVGQVRQERLAMVEGFIGTLEASQEIAVSATVDGQIDQMRVEEGERVKRGQPLFELDARADTIALARTRAELDKAEHELTKLETGSRPEEIEEARTRLVAAEAVMAAAKDAWERVNELAAQGIAAASELVKARSDYDLSEAQLSQAKARLELIRSGFRNEEILVAEAEVRVRKAQMDEIQRRLDERRVLAPANGVIVRRLKEHREWTGSGETVLVLLVLDPMRLRIEVGQRWVTKVGPGLKASVSIPGLEDSKYEATVMSVIPQAQLGSRNFPVLLRLSNVDLTLAAGMFAKVDLKVEEGRDVLIVPREAIQYRDQKLVIYRVDGMSPQSANQGDPGSASAVRQDAMAREVEVRVTQELERRVVIEPNVAGELWDGCEVVVMGGTRLKNGSPLHRLAPAGWKEESRTDS